MGIGYGPDGEAVRASGGRITREGVTHEALGIGARGSERAAGAVGDSGIGGDSLLVADGGPGGETTGGSAFRITTDCRMRRDRIAFGPPDFSDRSFAESEGACGECDYCTAVACPRCGGYGPDGFGPQLAGGWHEGCAADEAHERHRDSRRW